MATQDPRPAPVWDERELHEQPYQRSKHFKSALELRNMRDAGLPREEWEAAKDYRDSKD